MSISLSLDTSITVLSSYADATGASLSVAFSWDEAPAFFSSVGLE
jgi:hypothetical protein